MADVYLARRRAGGIEKWLVVKRMRPETSGDPRFLDLFVREARLSMSLVHQNIVPVFDFGRIDDQVFLAMERVEGKDLGSSLARGAAHRMPPMLAAFIAAECCQALDYAHQRKSPDGVALGIVHRDVTPRNVLLSWSGEVKLTDFGIAALAGDATSRLLGTPHYMAPEQARSEPIDPRADIYAIGLVLREAVTGVRPRPGSDRETLLDAARRGELRPWPGAAAPPIRGAGELAIGTGDHSEEPPLPDALREIIDKATSPVAADRYPDARSMLEALDSFIVEERAARKGESPARQLAAWLAVVWEGARDDLEADAAIEGNHLVSFLDDGALDVVGTGTVRSMAATAADSQPVAVIKPVVDVPALRPAPALANDPPLRPGLISSSHVTVASGSFEAMPKARDALAEPAAKSADAVRDAAPPAAISADSKTDASQFGPTVRVPPRRAVATWISVALAGAAAAVVVLIVAGRGEPARPPSGHVEPVAIPPSVEAHAPPPELHDTPPPAPTAEPARPPAPPPVTPHPQRPPSGHPTSGHPNPANSANPANPESVAIAHTPPAPVPAVPTPGSAAPPTCKVRINLSPWAYFTADGDATRHETPSTVELTPGKHRLHVWNPELHVERDITIHVPADRDSMNYSEPIQPSTLPPPGAPPSMP